jgi:hypothetical protein
MRNFKILSPFDTQCWHFSCKARPFVMAITASTLLCGFTKPLTPVTSYSGVSYAKLVKVYQHAYGRIGMTKVEVVSEPSVNLSDGTKSTFEDYTFSFPSGAKSRKVGGTEFGITSLTKNGMCIKCDITRTTYWGDEPDKNAAEEIKRALGKSVPFEPGSS